MGKGDIKSKRGKIVNGSYGVRRRKKKANTAVANTTAANTTTAKEPVKVVASKEVVKETAAKEVTKAPAKKKEKAKK